MTAYPMLNIDRARIVARAVWLALLNTGFECLVWDKDGLPSDPNGDADRWMDAGNDYYDYRRDLYPARHA